MKRNVMHWRMQLHPNHAGESVAHCVNSLAAGYIGLDFAQDVGDLTVVAQAMLPEKEKHYWAFAHDMKLGDRVLIMAHHFPFALVTIAGEYNYIRVPAPEIGVWFRHFRAVTDVRYYADLKTNARQWSEIVMTGTISPLRAPDSLSYRLIERWLRTT